MRRAPSVVLTALVVLLGLAACARDRDTPAKAAGAAAGGQPAARVAIDVRPFPREFTVDGTTFDIHQPQYDRWTGGLLEGRAAMSVHTGTRPGPDGKPVPTQDFGVLWFQARTEVDKGARAVVLTDIRFPRASFPTAQPQEAKYLGLARRQMATRSTLTLPLDQLEAAMVLARVDAAQRRSQPVRNHPPEIIFSTRPSVLVLVEGQPRFHATATPGVRRLVNTRSLLLERDGAYFLALAGHWLGAPVLNGPWRPVSGDAGLEAARKEAQDGRRVDTLDTPPEGLRRAFENGGAPDVYVRTHPAELITTRGEPEFAEIPGTQLAYIANTGADVLIDRGADNAWYALVSGRWFGAPGARGPWRWIPPDLLPKDFARIPPDSPKSGVLASIAGTPESREALIANAIPQNATVERGEAHLDVQYDGEPDFVPIEGTVLYYARNTPVPVIRVAIDAYYALDKGVWFTAPAAAGPWSVADAVPAVVYTIPTSSPLHYVTYVRVYGSEGDEVYVGYTPGYYGTVESNDVVVYGTGYECEPWIGEDGEWYGCPETYGLGTYFGWNEWTGWTFGWGWGWYDGWYGPGSPWWGPWWGPSYPWGWWNGGAAAWNVYGKWGNAAVRGTAAAWANPWTGHVGTAARGGYYNEATGGRGIGRAAVTAGAIGGATRAMAQGIRYNPNTGRVVAGDRAIAMNDGRVATGGDRTVVNADAGRIRQGSGGMVAGDAGAVGGRTFDVQGARGEAQGAAGFHYNADTGAMHHGGVANVNDNVYASRDGNVYKYENGHWNKVDLPRDSAGMKPTPTASTIAAQAALDQERVARERGDQRVQGGWDASGAGQQAAYNYGRSAGAYDRRADNSNRTAGGASRPTGGTSRPVGGYRPSLGRGGGGRRR